MLQSSLRLTNADSTLNIADGDAPEMGLSEAAELKLHFAITGKNIDKANYRSAKLDKIN